MLGLNVVEDFREARAGLEVASDEVSPCDKWLGDERFVGEFLGLGIEKFVVVGEAVGRCAIDAVELHFLGESWGRHEAFEGGFSHLLNVHELHVTGDHVGGVADDGVRIF